MGASKLCCDNFGPLWVLRKNYTGIFLVDLYGLQEFSYNSFSSSKPTQSVVVAHASVRTTKSNKTEYRSRLYARRPKYAGHFTYVNYYKDH